MAIRHGSTYVPPEIAAAQRKRRGTTVRLYIIAAVVVLGACLGSLVLWGLHLKAELDANQHVANAITAYAQGHLAQAEREMRAGVAVKSDDYNARFDLGILLLKEGKYAEAIPQLRQAETIGQVPTAYLYAAVGELAEGHPALAHAEIQPALAKVPNDPDVNGALALADQALGHKALAAHELATARADGYSGSGVRGWISEAQFEQSSGTAGG